MRLFRKKAPSPASPSGSARAEAEAELRRAVEALGMPPASEDGPPAWEPPPAAVDLSVEEDVDEAVPVPGEADVPWEEAQDAGSGRGPDDPLPEEEALGEPARRRVRKVPPGATQPARRSTAGGAAARPRTSAQPPGSTRQRRTST